MKLEQSDAELFYQLWFPLLDFVNRKHHVCPETETIGQRKGIDARNAKKTLGCLLLYAARFDAYIFGCVPPPLIPPKPNPPSLNEERHFEHMFRMPLFPIYLFIFHYTPKKGSSPREAAAPHSHTPQSSRRLCQPP